MSAPAAAGDGLAHELQRPMQHRHGLLEIDDVDAVALAEDEGLHLRVPAPGGVAEVNASFQELAHGKGRRSHAVLFSG